MSKRKLTQQQNRRITRGQQRSVARVQDPAGEDDDGLGAEQRGLVIAHYGRQLDIEPENGALAGGLVRCRLRSNIEPLVTGDRVVWRPEAAAATTAEPTGVVVAGLPRRSILTRPDSHSGRPKPIAANIDRVVVVIAPQPEPHPNLIDRYFVAAELLNIEPLLLLNKTDLLTRDNANGFDELVGRYQRIGYRTLRASTVRRDGLDALRAALQGHTSILVGQSGVGKSSLIGALLPGIDIRVGALSEGEGKGRHTTTTARLFHLPPTGLAATRLPEEPVRPANAQIPAEPLVAGGDLIDSPGVREFALGHFERSDIASGFVEFRPWLGYCRFRDCQHGAEPGCALHEAHARGDISAERMRSYRAIVAGPDS